MMEFYAIIIKDPKSNKIRYMMDVDDNGREIILLYRHRSDADEAGGSGLEDFHGHIAADECEIIMVLLPELELDEHEVGHSEGIR